MGKKTIISTIFVIFGLVIISFVAFKAYKASERNRKIENEIATIRTEAEKIRKDNRELEEKIGYFQTPEFQEKIAKEKLNFQKADEEVVVIKSSPSMRPEKEDETKESLVGGAEGEKTSNYRKWWNYFFERE